jgi:MYXO-CTERM domain-containing protein
VRHRETIALWALAVVFATACVLLGRWQLDRYEDKSARKQLVTRNYDTAPVPLAQVLASPDAAFDPADQWRQVRVSGTYDAAGTTLVRNRPRRGSGATAEFGYEVVVPLRLADGSALLVDRGWLPSGSGSGDPGQAPDAVPPPPGGRVEVVARLRPSEPARSGRLPQGQALSVTVPGIGARLGYPVHGAYGVLVQETPATQPAPAPLDPPVLDGGEGINASYAVQWGLFALLGLAFPVWVRRRRRTLAAEQQAVLQHVEDPGRLRDLEPAPPRRRRIWDADDE